MKQRKLGRTDLDAEVGQQAAALGQGEMQVTVAELAQLTRHPQPVQPQRGVNPAGQDQLGGLGRPALDQVRHVPGYPGPRRMEVIDHDRRPCGQLRGIVGDRRDDIGRHVAVHGEQVGGIGAEPRRHRLGGLDETGPEADRVSVGLIARQPRSSVRRSCRRPARQQHALAGASRPHHNGQALAGPRRQLVMERGSYDQRGGQCRRPELRPREPQALRSGVPGSRTLHHATLRQFPLIREHYLNLARRLEEGTKVLLAEQ